MGGAFWEGADLVMEVVSGDERGRERDLDTKRRDYAEAGIPVYWVVDPLRDRIIVLTLRDGRYERVGEFAPGEEVFSVFLPGFRVPVAPALSPPR